MKQQIICFLHGCVQIRVNGGNIQRFINVCRMQGLVLWDVRPVEDCVLWMDLESFWQLRGIIRKTGVKIHILEKRGIPFLLYRNRKRKGFCLGILSAFCIVQILAGYIWDVQVTGNYSHSAEEIIKFLNTQKVYAGMKKEEIRCDDIEKKLRNTFFDITWVSAEIDGTRLIIHLKENEQKLSREKEETEQTVPMDIVASKDAKVISVVTRNGTPQIQADMEVKKGDLLVYGHYQVLNDSKEVVRTQYLTADAEILGQVSYEYEDSFPLQFQQKTYLEEKNSYAFRVGGERFNLYKKESEKQIDTITEEKQLRLYENFYLPVYIIENTKKKYKITEGTYTKEEAEDIAQEKLTYFLQNLEKNTIQIIENNVTIEVNDTMCYSRGTITVIEQIGEAVPATVLEEQTEEQTGE